MAYPFTERPYDMVHVHKTVPSAQCELPVEAINSIRKEVEAERAPFVEETRELQARMTRMADVIRDSLTEPKRQRAERATRPMVIGIDRKLREVLVDNGDGTWSYKGEWDDRLVAAALGAKKNQVRYHRMQCFGPFPEKKAATDPVAARTYALVVNLYKRLGFDLPE